MRSRRFISVIAIALLAPTGMLQPAFSHGGLAENCWNPAHLQNLPPEIRASVQKWDAACGGSLAAAQQFALYLTVPGAQFVALHFDDFRCGNKSVHCDTTGCLHEVYRRNQWTLSPGAGCARPRYPPDQLSEHGRGRDIRWRGRQDQNAAVAWRPIWPVTAVSPSFGLWRKP